MPSTKGYRSYHGKGGAGRIVLIVLLCLILLAAVGFLVLQRYAVYGSDGSIRFDLPRPTARAGRRMLPTIAPTSSSTSRSRRPSRSLRSFTAPS